MLKGEKNGIIKCPIKKREAKGAENQGQWIENSKMIDIHTTVRKSL